jgi:hypothetical protein
MPNPLALIGSVAGLAQSIIGGINARKTQKKLEKMQSPVYKQNQGILDYYNKALARYNVSPTDSALYKRQMQNVGRGVASGMQGLQDRRSAIAGMPAILRAANDASLNAEVAAENERNQRFGQLGGATSMKAGEDRMAFQQNELAPFERKYNLLSQKAAANAQTFNTGLSNIFGGLQNLSMANIVAGGDGNIFRGMFKKRGNAAKITPGIASGFNFKNG